jgi:signal transduction histidine kinase
MTHEAQDTAATGANGHAVPSGQKATSVEKELSEFSYIVSHDLAASCRHLAQFSQLLLRDLGPLLTDPQRNYAKHIQAAGEKCQAMMEQLLVFSRIQSRELNSAPHDALAIIGAAQLQLGEKLRECGAEISVDGAGIVIGDADLLTMTFRELIDNAMKFRKPDQNCRIHVTTRHEHGRFIARVADNGIGLADDVREKAFRMFWQRKPDGLAGGIGAGLAICRRVARRHGGDVRFIDHDDGCCLELDLPAPPIH